MPAFSCFPQAGVIGNRAQLPIKRLWADPLFPT